MSARSRVLLLPLVAVLLVATLTDAMLTAPAAAAPKPPAGPCANAAAIRVPGAEFQRVECQTDLSATALAAKGRSDISDWAGLHSKRSTNPPAGAGIQTATSRTTPPRTRPTAGTTTRSS
jgi:hypothetical protein